jgi:hypothetical protein
MISTCLLHMDTYFPKTRSHSMTIGQLSVGLLIGFLWLPGFDYPECPYCCFVNLTRSAATWFPVFPFTLFSFLLL